MSKITITDKKLIPEFVGSLFKAIATKRAKKNVLKQLSKDPVIKRSIQKIAQIDKETQQYLDKKMKDPEFNQDMKDLGIDL
tara:strand:+ start:38 stop:280 length:243 start_codon:yes stop_codon:yes gene_type:complete